MFVSKVQKLGLAAKHGWRLLRYVSTQSRADIGKAVSNTRSSVCQRCSDRKQASLDQLPNGQMNRFTVNTKTL